MKKNRKKPAENRTDKITRKEAIKKAGVTALTASSLMFLHTKAHASGSNSPASPNSPNRNPRSGE